MDAQRYRALHTNAAQIAEDLDQFWEQLSVDDQLRSRVEATGIDPALVLKHRREAMITVRQTEGLDEATTTIIVSFAPVAAIVVKDLWTHAILPWIKRRRGADVLED